MAQQRITITIDPDLLEELRNQVPSGEVSSYVVEAARHAPSVVFTTDPYDLRRFVERADDVRIVE